MPLGPAPAPAEMQSYVSQKFGNLSDKNGKEFCSPCMDDIKVSSEHFEEHVEHMDQVCSTASRAGFEFKAKKGQYNQPELEFWGVLCSAEGRRAMPKKVEQLEQWPVPTGCDDVVSFLAFVNIYGNT
jgi:hypothetical protein